MTKELEDYFARALAAKRGLSITFGSKADATAFRHRMNSYRSRIRKNSKGIYPPADPLYDRTPYDGLTLSIDPDQPNIVLIRSYAPDIKEVKEL